MNKINTRTNKKKKWTVNPALEAETAITQLPILDHEYHRKQVAQHIETSHAPDERHSNYNTNSEIQKLKSIQTNLKNNEATITKADKGNSIVILHNTTT
jgi:hypothetical protein